MDQELRAYLEEMEARMEARADEREARLEARMDERFERVDERFEKVETEGRQTRVLLEGMSCNLRLAAEGLVHLNERIDAFREETKAKFAEIKMSIAAIHQSLQA